MRILVVDDSALYRKILTDAASSALGTEAVAVSNGESALKKLASEKFDLVLLDVFMDGMNGIVYEDDDQVVDLHSTKRYAINVGVDILIKEILC